MASFISLWSRLYWSCVYFYVNQNSYHEICSCILIWTLLIYINERYLFFFDLKSFTTAPTTVWYIFSIVFLESEAMNELDTSILSNRLDLRYNLHNKPCGIEFTISRSILFRNSINLKYAHVFKCWISKSTSVFDKLESNSDEDFNVKARSLIEPPNVEEKNRTCLIRFRRHERNSVNSALLSFQRRNWYCQYNSKAFPNFWLFKSIQNVIVNWFILFSSLQF